MENLQGVPRRRPEGDRQGQLAGRDEVVGTTTVVIVYTVVVGVFLFAVDAAFTPVINWFFASFGQ